MSRYERGVDLKKTPKTVKVRVRKRGNYHYVMQRSGRGWRVLFRSKSYDEALAELEKLLGLEFENVNIDYQRLLKELK